MPNADGLGNKILDRLREPDLRRVAGLVERVSPPLGEVVAEPGTQSQLSTSR